MSATGTAVAAIAGKQMFEKLIKELADTLQQNMLVQYKKWKATTRIHEAYRIANKIRKVKTIWQLDKPIDLSTFYCDPFIHVSGKRRIVQGIDDLPPRGNVLIEGIAGQGKSMLLRNLCASELKRGRFLPLMIELRKVNPNNPLKQRLFAAFKLLDLELDEPALAAVAATGRVALFLDAFDEVEESYRAQVVNDIDDLAEQFPSLRVFVTSRPHQAIKASRHFTVASLDFMRGKEYEAVLAKLSESPEVSEGLVRYIDNEGKAVKGLLVTPLLVTLFVLAFKHGIRPKLLCEFYHDLQPTLLARHDGTKPGYVRERASKLYNDIEFTELFETLCILAMQSRRPSFSQKEVYELSKKAIAQCSMRVDSKAYIDDVVKITCLLVNEGDEYRFIHQTVRDYNAASFVAKKPEAWAQEYYARLTSLENQSAWAEVLRFLSEIDTYRFNKFFFLPLLKEDLQLGEERIRTGNVDVTGAMKEKLVEGIWISSARGRDGKVYETRIMADPPKYYARNLLPELIRRVEFSNLGPALEDAAAKGTLPPANGSLSRFLPAEAFKNGQFHPLKALLSLSLPKGADSFLQDYLIKLAKTARAAMEGIRSEEKTDILKGLLS